MANETWSTAHPLYQLEWLPADVLTPAFRDISWHNESCPRFHHIASGWDVFVDWPNPEDRETGGKRYSIAQWVDNGETLSWHDYDSWTEAMDALEDRTKSK